MTDDAQARYKAALDKVARDLTDQGRLIEAGWITLRALILPRTAPAVQIDEMRKAFFAGAQHLFASIVSILEPDADVTEADLRRMSLIHEELERFRAELEASLGVRRN